MRRLKQFLVGLLFSWDSTRVCKSVWSLDPPRRHGWYWARERGKPSTRGLVLVFDVDIDTSTLDWNGFEIPFNRFEFAGPLDTSKVCPPPKEPGR